MKKPRHRGGATTGLSNASWAGCFENHTEDRLRRQAEIIARRYNVTLSHAFVVAELAFAAANAGGR